jgi:hypothetical protein
MRLIVATVSLYLAIPACAVAQANPDIIERRNDCRFAVQVLTRGHPADRTGDARWLVKGCSEAGGPLAQAFRGARGSVDTAYLNRVTSTSETVRDGVMFAASLEIALDRAASVHARLFAVRNLLWALAPGGNLNLASLAPDTSGYVPCSGTLGASTELIVVMGTPLPPNWVEQVRAVGSELVATCPSPTASEKRRGAWCVSRWGHIGSPGRSPEPRQLVYLLR